MATLAQLRTRVDAWLLDKWPAVVSRQSIFLTNTGRYWQGLRTHTIVPIHTTSADGDALADKLDGHPTDQVESWSGEFSSWVGVTIAAALEIEVYDGPQGKGWVATIWVRHNGVLYARSQNVGPESSRTKAWAIVDETAPI